MGIHSQTSLASCAEFDIKEAMIHDDAVFSGKVIKIEPKAMKEDRIYYDLVLFEIDSIWKGLTTNQIILKNESQYDNVRTSVEQLFVMDESYLVYAYKEDAYLQTNPCKGTKFISLASDDLSFLGEGTKPTEEVDLEDSLKGKKEIFGFKAHHFKHKVFVILNIALIAGVILTSCYLLYRIWRKLVNRNS